MNRAEHEMRMCFDPEYAWWYNFFLSRKSNKLKLLIISFMDNALVISTASLMLLLLGNFGIYIASLVLSVPLKLLTFLEFSGLVLIVYILIFSVMCLCLFIDYTVDTIFRYKNTVGRYLKK
jgi:hypothetical protein